MTDCHSYSHKSRQGTSASSIVAVAAVLPLPLAADGSAMVVLLVGEVCVYIILFS